MYRILLLLSFALFFANEKFLVRIPYSGLEQLKILSSLDLNFDHHRNSYEVDAFVTDDELFIIQERGFNPIKINNEAREYYLELKEQTKDSRNPLGEYHNYIELTQFLNDIAISYPEITNLFSIGQSVQGRELWVLEISDNPGVNEIEPEFKYVANMHGDETPGRELSLYLIDWLCSGYGTNDRATELVNNTAIYIMPSMNPDGFELGQRYNANGVDLNRDFPDQFNDPDNSTGGRQPETRAVMDWSDEHNFVLSANMHSGALVANYPFDGPNSGSYSACPDDDVFVELALVYSENHPTMYNSTSFEDGITNGAEWYAVSGGMQDWNYVWEEDFDITLEQSNTKWPNESLIDDLWDDNKESMIKYLEMVHTGVRGLVTHNGSPVEATIEVSGIDYDVSSDYENGDYYRLLTPGTYEVTARAIGYSPETAIITVDASDAEVYNFLLSPDPNLENAEIEDFEFGDFSGYDWASSGSQGWVIDSDEHVEGQYSARSGDIENNQQSILSVDVDIEEDSEISFYAKVSCEPTGSVTGNYYDYLSFKIDGDEQDKWAGEIGWTYREFPIQSGSHTLTWLYNKDQGVTSGEDAVWIDYIVFPGQSSSDIVVGDVNFDGATNILDVISLISYVLDGQSISPGTDIFTASDINSDGILNILDIVGLVGMILG